MFLGEFEAYSVDVDNLNGGVSFEILAQFGYIDVHTACGEIGIVFPYFLESAGAVDELVEVDAEEFEQFAFLGGQPNGFVVFKGKGLIVVVEFEFADGELVVFGFVFIEGASYGGVDASEKFFHTERFGDIVVGADFKAFEFVGFE